jgi:hypothetical protein
MRAAEETNAGACRQNQPQAQIACGNISDVELGMIAGSAGVERPSGRANTSLKSTLT